MSRATVGLLSSATAAATTATSSLSRTTLSFSVTNSPPTPSSSSTSSSSSSSSASTSLTVSFSPRNSLSTTRRTPRVRCEVALKSDSKTSSDLSTPSSTTEDGGDGGAKIGARVRVKVPLKVHHVPRVPEVDLTGKEGVLKHYVGVWKGKRISANYPYKVEFFIEVEGRGPVKFFAHLKEEEFDYI